MSTYLSEGGNIDNLVNGIFGFAEKELLKPSKEPIAVGNPLSLAKRIAKRAKEDLRKLGF